MNCKDDTKVCAIIVAAGSGSRYGSTMPKQFCDINGRPVLMEAIDRLKAALPGRARIMVVLNAGFIDLWEELCERYGFESPEVVAGGETRWHSVKNAIDRMDEDVDFVAVHDAARPMVVAQVADRLLEAVCGGHQGAIPAIAPVDSLRMCDGKGGSHSVDRSAFRIVQTPQMFRADLLREAYGRPYSSVMTDDASVMESAGFTDVVLVEGHEMMMKITRPHDIAIVELLSTV